MTLPRSTLLALAVLSMLGRGVQAQEALDSVEKKVAEAWSRVKSLSAKAVTDTNFENQPIKTFGILEYMNDGGRELARVEVTMQRKLPDRTAEVKTAMIYDGTFMYTVTDHGGPKAAAKQSPNNLNIAPGGRRFFSVLKQKNVLRVLPDEKVDGEDMFVIEARPHVPDPQAANLILFYMSKSTGLRRKAIGTDADGKVVFSSEYTEIKLDGLTSADRSKFEPPSDLDVIDATKPPTMVTP